MNLNPHTFKFLPAIAFAALSLCPFRVYAQEQAEEEQPSVIVIDPLFEYPVAPEDINDLTGKSNYLMEHFWDAFDFKRKTAVDQIALNDAFRVYVTPMQWADKDVTLKSVDTMIAALSKNPTLLYQFTKAAEENLYSQRSKIWIDEIYLKFLNAIVRNKKLSESRKARYARQQKILTNTQQGVVPPAFNFTSPTGNPETFRPGLLTVIEFGDPGCTDCRHAKLKMETNVNFSGLVDKGLVNILFIIPDPDEGWQTELADYPKQWHVGASDSVSDIYDIRLTPTFYVIGSDGKIIDKNITVERAMRLAVENANK